MMKIGRRGLLLVMTLTWFLGIKPAIGLKCYVCNSVVTGHESCKEDKDVDKKFIVDCKTEADYEAAFGFTYYTNNSDSNLKKEVVATLTKNKFRGLYYWQYKTAKEVQDASDNNTDITEVVGIRDNNLSAQKTLVCRKLVTNIPYTVSENKPSIGRVLRMCGKRKESEEKLDVCEMRPATGKASVYVCTCNKDKNGKPCNSVQRPQISIFFVIVAFFVTIGICQWKN